MSNLSGEGFAALGWGAAIPDTHVDNEALETKLGLATGWIQKRLGVLTRPIAAPDQATSDLAILAGEDALASDGVDPDGIRLLILATSTPDYPLPPTAPVVAKKLGLKNAGAIDLAGACSGFLYGLTLADSFCRIHGGSSLIIGANLLSKRLNWQDSLTAGLFSDGAGAVVWGPVKRTAGIMGVQLESEACNSAQVLVPHGGSRHPIGPETYSQNGHLMKMDGGPKLFRKAVEAMSQAGEIALTKAGVSVDQIDLWIPHQANQRLIEEVGRRLGIPSEKVLNEVAVLGNASAATIPLVWARYVKNTKPAPNQKILMTSVGAGLISAGIVIQT